MKEEAGQGEGGEIMAIVSCARCDKRAALTQAAGSYDERPDADYDLGRPHRGSAR